MFFLLHISWNLFDVNLWFGPRVNSIVSLILLIISFVLYEWVLFISFGTLIILAFSPPAFTIVYFKSASDSFLVETSFNVWTRFSSVSNSFFNLSNSTKFAGLSIREDTSWLSPGFTNAI